MADQVVYVERGDGSGEVPTGVATIRLDRPPMNALSADLGAQLHAVADELAADDTVRAVVIHGGPKVFAAGADIKEFTGIQQADILRHGLGLERAIAALAALPKPVVAAISGYALGGGCELALAADFRVCGEHAKLGQPEILLGIIPGAGGTQRLPRLVGTAVAKDLVYSGRMIDAGEAEGIGLVDLVVPDEDVLSAALKMAARYATGPAIALAAAKAAIDDGLNVDLETGLRIERTLFAGLFGTEDKAEGVRSFIENGPGKATFTGR